MPPIGGWKTGVYCILNIKDGKRYVGSASKGLRGRIRSYQLELPRGKCHNRYLLRAWNKHGSKSFRFLIIERCSPKLCVEREQFWIDELRTANSKYGYNLSPTAGSVLGTKWSDESKARLSKAVCKQFESLELRKKCSEAANRRYERPGEREKISKTLKGRKLSPATRAKMSAFQRTCQADPIRRAEAAAKMKALWADPVKKAKRLLIANQKRYLRSITSEGDKK